MPQVILISADTLLEVVASKCLLNYCLPEAAAERLPLLEFLHPLCLLLGCCSEELHPSAEPLVVVAVFVEVRHR